MSDGVIASDVIRSMMRMGFSRDEIYDLLVSTGLHGEQIQLLIDRVMIEFREAKLEPQPSRLSKEMRKVFEDAFEEFQHTMLLRTDSLALKMEFLRTEFEKLGKRVVELGIVITQASKKRLK